MMLHRQSHSVMSLLALSLLLVCPHASAALEGRQVMEGDIFDSDPYGNNGYQSNDASVDTSDFGRIVGGTDATPMSAYPFYSFVTVTRTDDNGSSGTIGCGGSLIHDDIILTAAHCFLFDVTEVQVFVNRTQYSSLTGFEYFRRTESWQVHPGYNAATYANDVAMIHLTRSVTQVPPLQLNADAAIPADNSDVTVIGLGFISQEGGFPAALQQVTLQTVDSATCIAQNSAQIALEGATQVCAAADGKDSCQGDSGGPLFSTLPDGSFSQVGIVSFGIGCAQPEKPGVYARVSAYKEYIDTEICKLSRNPPNTCPGDPTPPPVPVPTTPAPTAAATPAPTPSPVQAPPTPSPTTAAPTPEPTFAPTPAPTIGPPIPVGNDPNSRSIQITKTGTVIATSKELGPLRMEQMDGQDFTLKLPGGLNSMDDLSISNEGFLFGLSIYTPALCSFQVGVTGSMLTPLSCITGEWSVTPWTGISAMNGQFVISGGQGGMTVGSYNTTSGMLNATLACLNCKLPDETIQMFSDVSIALQPLTERPVAALSTVWEDQRAGTIMVDLETFEELGRFVLDTWIGQGLAETVTNYPLVSGFYYAPQIEVLYHYVAHGAAMVYRINGKGETSEILLPVDGMEATTLAIDELNGVLVVGGVIKFNSTESVISVFDILGSPMVPQLRISSSVPGQLLSVSANGGKVAYVTAESSEIAIFDTSGSPLPTISPSRMPSLVPSMAPSNSVAPSLRPSDMPTMSSRPSSEAENVNTTTPQPTASAAAGIPGMVGLYSLLLATTTIFIIV